MKNLIFKFILFTILIAINNNSFCQWSGNPAQQLAITTMTATPCVNPRIIDDGNGGAIIAWCDFRHGTTNQEVYAQKVDANGIAQWTANGIDISELQANDQLHMEMVSDDAGGAIIVWEDERTGSGKIDVYAQKINAAGILQWLPAGGILLATSANSIHKQVLPEICTDGAGGAIVSWNDDRNGNYDIYAQRIDGSGILQWQDGSNPKTYGIPVCIATGIQTTSEEHTFTRSTNPNIVPDGAGGAFIVWCDERAGGHHVYGQRIKDIGTIVWGTNGILLESQTTTELGPEGLTAVENGIVFSYEATQEIWVSRVDVSGNLQWGNNGIQVSSAQGAFVQNPDVLSDETGGVFVAWWQVPSSSPWTGTSTQVFTRSQRVDAGGNITSGWPADGIEVGGGTANSTTINRPYLYQDGNANMIVAWGDGRATGMDNSLHDIFANCVNAAGVEQSPDWGFAVTQNVKYSHSLRMTRSGNSIITWMDQVTGVLNIYAAHVNNCSLTGGELNASLTQTNSCDGLSSGGATVSANGGTAPYTYLWSPTGATTATVTGLSIGNYTVTIKDDLDSTIIKTITINANPNPSVTQSGTILTANTNGASYQWIDCNNGNSPIANATNQSYTPTTNGSYAVIINQNGCSDTSSCVNITGVGIIPLSLGEGQGERLFPNPTNGLITLLLSRKLNNVAIKLINVTGQTVMEKTNLAGDRFTFDISEQVKGFYFIEVNDAGNISRIKLVKQ